MKRGWTFPRTCLLIIGLILFVGGIYYYKQNYYGAEPSVRESRELTLTFLLEGNTLTLPSSIVQEGDEFALTYALSGGCRVIVRLNPDALEDLNVDVLPIPNRAEEEKDG